MSEAVLAQQEPKPLLHSGLGIASLTIGIVAAAYLHMLAFIVIISDFLKVGTMKNHPAVLRWILLLAVVGVVLEIIGGVLGGFSLRSKQRNRILGKVGLAINLGVPVACLLVLLVGGLMS